MAYIEVDTTMTHILRFLGGQTTKVYQMSLMAPARNLREGGYVNTCFDLGNRNLHPIIPKSFQLDEIRIIKGREERVVVNPPDLIRRIGQRIRGWTQGDSRDGDCIGFVNGVFDVDAGGDQLGARFENHWQVSDLNPANIKVGEVVRLETSEGVLRHVAISLGDVYISRLGRNGPVAATTLEDMTGPYEAPVVRICRPKR